MEEIIISFSIGKILYYLVLFLYVWINRYIVIEIGDKFLGPKIIGGILSSIVIPILLLFLLSPLFGGLTLSSDFPVITLAVIIINILSFINSRKRVLTKKKLHVLLDLINIESRDIRKLLRDKYLKVILNSLQKAMNIKIF